MIFDKLLDLLINRLDKIEKKADGETAKTNGKTAKADGKTAQENITAATQNITASQNALNAFKQNTNAFKQNTQDTLTTFDLFAQGLGKGTATIMALDMNPYLDPVREWVGKVEKEGKTKEEKEREEGNTEYHWCAIFFPTFEVESYVRSLMVTGEGRRKIETDKFGSHNLEEVDKKIERWKEIYANVPYVIYKDGKMAEHNKFENFVDIVVEIERRNRR